MDTGSSGGGDPVNYTDDVKGGEAMPRRAFYRYEGDDLRVYSADYPPSVYYTIYEQIGMEEAIR